MTFNRLFFFLSVVISVDSFNAFAQISITHPFERMIFQRNNSNQANINIAGTYYSAVNRVEARVIALQGGTTTDWVVIQNNPVNGYFSGTFLVTGGWYSLEVRAYNDSVLVDTKILDKVGVGEVFAIAGQSNAQGGGGQSVNTPAIDDRVNSVNYANDLTDYNKLPLGFSNMSSDSARIGPFHYVPWAWGRVGDLLAARLGVPILFYGAGHGGTSSNDWSKSAQGLPYDGESWKRQDLGAPYRALENSVSYYGSLTGLRGVLWHQGESDPNTFLSAYYHNIKTVIDKTRENTEHNLLAWVIARASRNPDLHFEPILGQNTLIAGFNNDPNYSPIPNVFAGPNTDVIYGTSNRTDGIHFDTYAGQIEFANAWDAYLDSTFFVSSTPMMSSPLIAVSVTCNIDSILTPIKLSMPAGYNKYAWSNRQNSSNESIGVSVNCCKEFISHPPINYEVLNWRILDSVATISVASARVAGNVRKKSQKTLFSPIIDLTVFNLPTTPIFSASVQQIRPSENLTLIANNCNGNYLWSTGARVNPLVFIPDSTNSYTVQCKTLYCISPLSFPQKIIVSSCFPNSLSLSGSVNNIESAYASTQSIQSNQVVQLSGKIDYSAKTKVEFLPGFEVKAGAVFSASIIGCD